MCGSEAGQKEYLAARLWSIMPVSGQLAEDSANCAENGSVSAVTSSTDRLSRTGLVFQFPERHFLASNLQQVCADSSCTTH